MRPSPFLLVALLAGACTFAERQTQSPAAASDGKPGPTSVLGLSLAPDRSWPGANGDIYGLRLGIAGARHHHVAGLDLPGLSGYRTGSGGGLAAALFINDTAQSFYGVQLAGFMNSGPYSDRSADGAWGLQVAPANLGNAAGIQIGLVNGIAPTHDVPHNGIAGLQFGLWNAGGDVHGVQGGLASMSYDAYGLQVGALTSSHRLLGLQIGILNTTERGGLQIGLLNYNHNSILPWCPGLNLSW